MACADLTIVDDSLEEGDEIMTLMLSTADPAVTVATGTRTVTITDNDGMQILLPVSYKA